MSAFNQSNQRVEHQYNYNAAGDINFGAVQNPTELVIELEKLKSEITKARDAQAIDAELVTDVQYHVQKAIDQAKKPETNKDIVSSHLGKAKEFLKGLAEAGGIVAGIVKAIELVQQLF